MGICYNKLFELMKKRGLKKYDLRKNGFSPTIVDRLVKNNNVNTSTIIELCKLLDCQPGDILEYIPDDEKETSEAPEQPEEDQAENTVIENSRESIENMFKSMNEGKEDDKKCTTSETKKESIKKPMPNSREEIEAMFAKMSEKNKVSEPRKKNGYKMHSLTGEEAESIYSRTDVEEKIEQEKKRK